MYQNFYNFMQKPFDVTPDPKFLYMSRNHEETLAAIIYGIRERRGFITIIGEVGTGKTTLLNATLEKLDDKTAAAFIFNTDVTFEELLHMALVDFGLATAEESLPKFVALDRLNRFATAQFAAGKNIVIIIDEAQTLNLHTMENLRLLSNLETPRYKLVQIVLSGQPELDEKLQRQEMRQLAQRINLKRYITPLDKTDTYRYIRHHLKIAGCPDDFFDKPSLELIWTYSGGIPRKINILCDNALLIGYGLGKKKITCSEIQEAIRDLSWSPFSHKTETPPEVKHIRDLRKSRFTMLRIASASAALVLALLLGAISANFWRSAVDIPEIIPAFSRYLRAAVTSPRSPAPPPDPGGIRSDARQDYPKIPAKPEEIPLPNAATENPVLEAISPNQILKARPPAEETINQETYPPLESEKALQTVVKQHFIAKPSPILREEATNEPADKPFNLIVVRKGDSLSGIIENNHGDYEEMLPQVLQANTQIQNPDLILPGWVIRLPRQTSAENPVGNMIDNNRSLKAEKVSPFYKH